MTTYRCRTCGVEGVDNFYKTAKYQCKSCWNQRTAQTGKDKLKQLRDERGGCCERCGYDRCDSALQWHHTDPTQKEFAVGNRRGLSLDQLREEVSKCQLLCANCHCEVHAAAALGITLQHRETYGPA